MHLFLLNLVVSAALLDVVATTHPTQCPSLTFDPPPPLHSANTTTKVDQHSSRCGGHLLSRTPLILHDEGHGNPFLSASYTFEHYNTETLCFEQQQFHDDQTHRIFQTDAVVVELIRDVHTAPVHNYGRRASDISTVGTDQYKAKQSVSDTQAYELADSLCPRSGRHTLQTWASTDECGYWGSRYLTAGAACVEDPLQSYVEIIELTGVPPKISVTYQITAATNQTVLQFATMDNKRNRNHPGNMQLRSIDFVDSGTLYPHPFTTRRHIVHGNRWYEFIDGQMNKLDERNIHKAFWASLDASGRNDRPTTFHWTPSGKSYGMSAFCDYGNNLHEVSSSSTKTLTPSLGISDFRGQPYYNDTDHTVTAHSHIQMRIRPTFELRLPIIKTWTQTGYLREGDFRCWSTIQNTTFQNDHLLECHILKVSSPGIMTFSVIHDCDMVTTRRINLLEGLSFNIPVAIYNETIWGHVCTEHGVCSSVQIGRNNFRHRIYQEEIKQPSYVSTPGDSPLEGFATPSVTLGSWEKMRAFLRNLFTLPWGDYLAGGIGIALVVLVLLTVWKCGCCPSCSGYIRQKKRSKRLREIAAYEEAYSPYPKAVLAKKTPPPKAPKPARPL